MKITELRLRRFRCFNEAVLAPASRLSLFVGRNGSGKTSLLEALGIFSFGRSLRGSPLRSLESDDKSGLGWQVEVETLDHRDSTDVWRARGQANELSIWALAEKKRISDAARAFPIQFLAPSRPGVVEEAPAGRRALIDWALFHVEPSYHETWKAYQRALNQRNKVLKGGEPTAHLEPWDALLVEYGEHIHDQRRRLVERMAEAISGEFAELAMGSKSEVRLVPGWGQAHSFRDALQAGRSLDQKAGFTRVGPHRADLLLSTRSQQASTVLSRGQQKLLNIAVLLALTAVVVEDIEREPILMLDDWASELDPASATALWKRLGRYPGQLFLTGFEAMPKWTPKASEKLFHVEQGGVSEC